MSLEESPAARNRWEVCYKAAESIAAMFKLDTCHQYDVDQAANLIEMVLPHFPGEVDNIDKLPPQVTKTRRYINRDQDSLDRLRAVLDAPANMPIDQVVMLAVSKLERIKTLKEVRQ